MTSTKDTVSRVAFGGASLLFVTAAVLQLNDADPAVWIFTYGVTAIICGAGALGIAWPSWVGLGWGIGLTGWSIWLAWIVFGPAETTPMFDTDAAGSPGLLAQEEAREMFGLWVLAAASYLYAWWTWGRTGERDS